MQENVHAISREKHFLVLSYLTTSECFDFLAECLIKASQICPDISLVYSPSFCPALPKDSFQ